jgi:hypothetical protein
LHKTCSDVIAAMVKNQSPSTYLLQGFAEGPNFVNNRFRTTLREAMYSKLILREYSGVKTISDDVLMYLRRLLVECYIVSFYPYIHFIYIDELLKRFQATGNFVNMRVAALVRIAFTINTLLQYHEEANSKISSQLSATMTNNVLNQWAETLKNYMTNVSRVDFNNKDASIQDVIVDLHTLSTKVSTQSMSLDELKDNIKVTQLQIRSIISRFKQINKERDSKIAQYGLLIFFLFVIVIISTVMIVFNLYKDHLLYALMGLICIIVIVKLAFAIMDLIKSQSSKKD